MKNIVFILFSFALAAEMEVDGNLKVTGTVDANGNPITNVGPAISMTDAINGNVLQNALRDDGVYEYKIVATKISDNTLFATGAFDIDYVELDGTSFSSNFAGFLESLASENWVIDKILPYAYNAGYQQSWNYFIFKRPISDD